MLACILAVDACVFEGGKLYYPKEVEACLNTIELDQAVFQQTQDFLEYYMLQYVEEQHYRGSALDLQKELSELRLAFQKLDQPLHAYLDAIAALFDSFEDAHLRFVRPSFYSVFEQHAPILIQHNGTDWFARRNPETAAAYEADPRFENLTQIYDKIIINVAGKYADEYLKDFAANHTHTLKDSGAKANHAIFSGFSQSDLRIEAIYDDEFEMQVKDGPSLNLARMIIPTRNISSNADFLTLYNQSLIVDPFANEVINKPVNQVIASDIATSEQLISTYEGFFELYKTNSDFVLTLESFSPVDFRAGIMKLSEGLLEVREQRSSSSRMFITVFGNQGGDPSTLECVLRMLTEYSRPIMPEMKIKRSEATELLSRTHNPYFNFEYYDILTGVELYNVNKSEQLIGDNIDLIGQYSEDFYYSSYVGVTKYADDEINKMLDQFEPLNFVPNELIVVTNGDCASAAGFFTHALREKNLALVAGIGLASNEFCGSSGGTRSSIYDYYAAVKDILSDTEKSKEYNNSAIKIMKEFIPLDVDVSMNLMAADGFELSFSAKENMDFKQSAADVEFEDVHLFYPRALTEQILMDLKEVITYNYSELGHGNQCVYTGAPDGELYREFYINESVECRKWACDSGYMEYVYGNGFSCIQLQELVVEEKAKWGAKDTAITVLSCILAVFCGLFGVWIYFKVKSCIGSGKSSGAVFATDEQAYT